jgi:putative transposase
MDSDRKELAIASFRFGVISEFVTGVRLSYGEKEKLLKEKSERAYKIPYTSQTYICRSTIKNWVLAYKDAGSRIEGLMPKQRRDKGHFRALDSSLQMAIRSIKAEKRELTGVALVNELRHRKYIGSGDRINLSVLYRFLKEESLQNKVEKKDRRSFEASLPNEMWQSDVLHGPHVLSGNKKKKAFLIATMDDHSRLIPHAEFYLTEKLSSFKDCLKQSIEKRGLPQKLYIDNGSCYKAINLEHITASLGIGISHTPPYTPQGRGKIERWFRYVRENFLVTQPKRVTLREINESFSDWVESYHNKVHGVTKQTPLARYKSNMQCVRPAPPELLDYFRFIEFRRVKKDRTFRLNGVVFEAPVDLIDQRVELKFHKESPEEIEIYHNEMSFGKATLLDVHVNFKVGRNSKVTTEAKESEISNGQLF